MVPKRKETLSGAAKLSHETKQARIEERKDLVKFELENFAAAAAATGTLQEATSRVQSYSCKNDKDKTIEILLECLKEFSMEGRENLICDMLVMVKACNTLPMISERLYFIWVSIN